MNKHIAFALGFAFAYAFGSVALKAYQTETDLMLAESELISPAAVKLIAMTMPEQEPPKETFGPWTPIIFSVYHTKYHGRTAANGSRYDHKALTCASNNHKFGTRLELRYKGQTVTVTDRMDKKLGKTRIDLSGAAFRALHPAYDMTDKTGTLLRGEWRKKK